jgi:trehalose 6-phosphate phosphatase
MSTTQILPGDAAAVVSALADASPAHALLLFDFDGTLCELAPTPDVSRLPDRRRTLLAALAARVGVTIGVVSGRRLADVRSRVGLGPPLYFAGLHGMEIEGGGEHFVHDGVHAAQGVIHDFRQRLERAVAGLTGVVVEDKALSFVLHTRQAAPAVRAAAREALSTLLERPRREGLVRLQHGDEMCEVLPNVPWSKGDAVRWIERSVRGHRHVPPLTMYVGDDLTDEHAFRAIGDRGLSVVVGHRQPSAARFRLPSPDAVEALLRMLVAMP